MLKKITSSFLFASLLLLASCSDDEDRLNVRYALTTEPGLNITSVSYRASSGDILTVTPQNPNQWSQEIRVDRPFTANFTAHVTNSSQVAKPYQLIIYDDNEEASNVSSATAPNAVETIANTFQFD